MRRVLLLWRRLPGWATLMMSTVGQLVMVLLLTSFVVYAAMDLAPGSREAVLFGSKMPEPETRARIAEQYGLDRGVLDGYLHWLGGVLHGDLGLSLATQTPVADQIANNAMTTVYLVVLASLLTTMGGVALGIVAALRPGRTEGAVMTFTAVGIATPTFVTATILLAVFGVALGWFPTYGGGSGFTGRVTHLLLPAIALAFLGSAFVARITRSAVRTELSSEHIDTARARGLSRWDVIRRHVLRNAMLPVTTAVGLQVASLISGTIIIERAFGLNGLGQLLVTAVNQKDIPTVQSVCLVMVTAFVIVSTLVDVSYRYLDPRIRTIGGSR